MEERKDIQAIKTTYDAANSKTKGVKNSIAEQKLLQKQKQEAYNKTLTKSTTVDPTTLKEYTTLTDPYGKVKDVSYHWGDKGGSLNAKQQAALKHNIKSHALNEQRKAAYKKQEEKHGKDSKQYKAVIEAAPLSSYMQVIPTMK